MSLALIRIRNQISDAGVALDLAIERLKLAMNELELAKKLVELETKRFLGGDSNLLLLNIREQNLAEAEVRKFEAFSEFKKSQNDLRAAQGVLDWKE